jgi:riboflavin synthase
MFTGLVEEVGSVEAFERTGAGARLAVRAGFAAEVRVGDSVSVNGCCLTATSVAGGGLGFDVLGETLRLTNLGALGVGKRVNLERALASGARMGGHFVQGHIDAVVPVLGAERKDGDLRMEFGLPEEFRGYVAYKGSVALNGTSLTVAEAGRDSFVVWIIPHTAQATNLGELRVGDSVNFECDILAKYVARLLESRGGGG